MKRVLLMAAAIAAGVCAVAGQASLDERFERAYDAWDRGDYVPAIQGFRELLRGADADRYFERIALITGELYPVVEVAPDGRSVRFSPNGRCAAYDTGARASQVTHLVDAEDGLRPVAEVRGYSASFSPNGEKIAFLRVGESPDIIKMRKDLEQLANQPEPDRRAMSDLARKLGPLEAAQTEVVVRDLRSGREQVLVGAGLLKTTLTWSADGGELWIVGAKAAAESVDIYAVSASSPEPRSLTSGSGFKVSPVATAGGRYLVYTVAPQSPFGQPSGTIRQTGGSGPREFGIVRLADGKVATFSGFAPAVSADGSTLAFLSQAGEESSIGVVKLAGELTSKVVKKSPDRILSLAVSPGGSRIAYEMTYTRNAEIFLINEDGTGDTRVTREIQPDRLPRFVTNTKILAVKGEPRHSRSYLYDVETLKGTRPFHNNTIRTIAPEYEWASNPAGTRLLIVAERDGDTISPERGVYLVDLTRTITREDLLARLERHLASERALRAEGDQLFKPIAQAVRAIADKVSIAKIYEFEEALFNFDSKYITQPGNRRAADYIFNTLKSFGYEPEYQWFTARDVKTANVLATLRGSENPELIYVLSSHFDSNLRSPGADDNSSGTAVLLETARLMVKSPMRATIIFAAFTGEEAGLLGSREFVRQAKENKLRLVGALNNDMIGWTNDHRLDNTIRYSNTGIRDLQHAASFLFSRMITYDARYFKATDAAAYYEAYGDIVGGFGSYPVLGNPYYHQPTDLLETVNHQLLVEATRANVASIMRLASGPSRVHGLKIENARPAGADLTWTPGAEKGIMGYIVAYGPADRPLARTVTVKEPKAVLSGLQLKMGETLHAAVRAIDERGLKGWDWARTSAVIAAPSARVIGSSTPDPQPTAGKPGRKPGHPPRDRPS